MNRFDKKQNKIIKIELLVLVMINTLFWLLLGRVDIFERLYHFSREHELYELDELIPLMGMLMVSFIIFSIRRWRDAREYALLVEKQVRKDELTGLYNRKALQRKIMYEFFRFQRYKNSFCILSIDIDDFSEVNEKYGRELGDSFLKQIAERLESNTRHVDICCRWGGEEFLILCPETKLANALLVAEKLRLTIQEPMLNGEQMTASFGVMEMKPNIRLEDIVTISDVALYQAKSEGKNCISVA